MEWSSFFGALVGVIVSLGGLIGGILIWDKLTQPKSPPIQPPKPPSLDDLREIQLEQDIVQRFDKLFPGWRIYNSSQTVVSNPNSNHKQMGIRYRTDAGEIDILCLDTKNNFVVIELKRNKAPDRVIAQVDRYIAWVEKNLAQPGQRVRGLIIARSIDKRLRFTLTRRRNIDIWIYDYQLRFDKKAVPKKSRSRHTLVLDESGDDETSILVEDEEINDSPSENPTI